MVWWLDVRDVVVLWHMESMVCRFGLVFKFLFCDLRIVYLLEEVQRTLRLMVMNIMVVGKLVVHIVVVVMLS